MLTDPALPRAHDAGDGTDSPDAAPSLALLADALDSLAAGQLPAPDALAAIVAHLHQLPRVESIHRRRRAVARVRELRASGLSDRAAAKRAERDGFGRAETIRQWVRSPVGGTQWIDPPTEDE